MSTDNTPVKANEYTSRMMALGLVPKAIREAVGKEPAKRPYPKNVRVGE